MYPIKYKIFCKYEQKWHEYDLDAYECQGSGTPHILFLRCHNCNNYWIAVDSKKVSDGIRTGYKKHLTKKQINAKLLFSIIAED